MHFWVRKKLQVLLLGLGVFGGVSSPAFSEGFDFVANGLILEKSSEQSAEGHPMPLSALKRVSNNLIIEKKTEVGGTRSNYLYRVSESATLEKASAYYRKLLDDQGSIVFECEQRNCGASNHWANDVFGNRNLAGRDSNQAYFVGRLDDGVHQGWMSIYAVTNARGISYIYLSFIPAPPEDYLADAKRGVLLTEAVLAKDWSKALGKYLAENGSARLVVVAFHKPQTQTVSLDEALKKSESFGQRKKGVAVQSLGLESSRVELRSMGSLGQRPLGFEGSEWAYLYLID